ncbi:MAG: hypothetical protein K1X75_06255 [Leptospirales bacterium]|nr:hypothetical protein [Leptospirales bacterium]
MIRYVFLHLDGVVLENILAPITLAVAEKLGVSYSAEVEANVFARPQRHAARFLVERYGLAHTEEDIVNLYHQERRAFESSRRIRRNAGLEPMLHLLRGCGYRVVCYGGADRSYFDANTRGLEAYFDGPGYIQTRDIRPGVRQIIYDIFRLDPRETLFMDEEAEIARAARAARAPFIAMNIAHPFSFQRQAMTELGVRYQIDALAEVTLDLLQRIENDADRDRIWE